MSPDFASHQIVARRVFLTAAWTFAGYNFRGTLVAWLAALPASNGEHGNVHTVGSQAVHGNGTALSPPLFRVMVWVLFVLAASRLGWLGRVGAALTFVSAVFYASAGELGELTTNTSPLTGAKWVLVLVLGSLGIALAVAVALAGVYRAGLAISNRRSRSTAPNT
jgi:hypothetical protein